MSELLCEKSEYTEALWAASKEVGQILNAEGIK
jgi:hypothetical protein